MKQGKRPRPVRSVQYGSIAVRIDLYEYVAVPHGPDVLRIALRKAPRVAVAFASQDLWGESDEPSWTVLLDLFDTYLEPA